jgi:serine/threonine protein kinase
MGLPQKANSLQSIQHAHQKGIIHRDIKRADVYGLGALLYELLAGRPPFDPAVLNRGGWAVMRRTILFENPAKPSAVVAGNKTAEPPAGRPSLAVLRGGLDWIVMKALEKDRKRRYQTVGALMENIERFQSHQPVQAAALCCRMFRAPQSSGLFFRRDRHPDPGRRHRGDRPPLQVGADRVPWRADGAG